MLSTTICSLRCLQPRFCNSFLEALRGSRYNWQEATFFKHYFLETRFGSSTLNIITTSIAHHNAENPSLLTPLHLLLGPNIPSFAYKARLQLLYTSYFSKWSVTTLPHLYSTFCSMHAPKIYISLNRFKRRFLL